jgi:hypothetical protein
VALNFLESLGKFGPLVALVLQAAVLSRFIAARNRDYPLAIFFLVGLFLVTAAGSVVNFYPFLLTPGNDPAPARTFLVVYSLADLAMHTLLLGLMLQLIRRTLLALDLPTRSIYLLGLISLAVAICGYYWFGGGLRTVILLKTRQVVSAWMVILNLYWWTLLLRRRQLDRRILLLSAGIGLLMTGQVISDGVSSFYRDSVNLKLLGAVLMYLTHFAALYTWYNAFRGTNAAPSPISPT